MTVRTLVLQSATYTAQYWVMALVDLANNSTCDPLDYSVVADGTGESLLFNWTLGNSITTMTYITCLVPSTNGQYLNVYIVRQDTSHKGTLGYNNPIQK